MHEEVERVHLLQFKPLRRFVEGDAPRQQGVCYLLSAGAGSPCGLQLVRLLEQPSRLACQVVPIFDKPQASTFSLREVDTFCGYERFALIDINLLHPWLIDILCLTVLRIFFIRRFLSVSCLHDVAVYVDILAHGWRLGYPVELRIREQGTGSL